MDRIKEIHELRRNLDELRVRSTSLKENFRIFGEMIDAEKFVVTKTLQALSDEFFGWMNIEELCLKRYHELFGNDAPETFSAFADALNAEEKKIRESSVQFQASKFLHLVTADPDLQKILDDHRKILAPIFERKRQSAKTKAALELYAKFIKALEEPDFGKKYAASREFAETFGDDFIGRGLFKGELILKMPEDDAIAPPAKATPKAAAKPSAKSSAKAAAKADDKSADKVDDEPPEDEPIEDSDFVKAINDAGALLTEADFAPWEKSFAVDRSERTKEFSASRFKRDFRNPETFKPILTYTALHGLIAAPPLCPGNMSAEFMENVTQPLLNKGYLQKFSIAGVGSFYSLTKNFFDFIKTDSGKKFIAVKQSYRNKVDTLIYPDFDFKKTLTRTIFFHLHDIEESVGNSFYDLKFYGQTFRAGFNGHGERDLFIGCLWDTTDECDKFLRRLKAYFKSGGEFTRVILVGLVLEQAGKIFDALEKSLPLFFPKAAAQYIYAFNDETFYRRDTHEKISREEIWNLPAPDDDPKAEKFSDTYDSRTSDENQPESEDRTPAGRSLADAGKMIRDGKFYCATAYLKAESLQEPEVDPIYRRLAYALDDPLIDATRSSSEMIALFEGELTTYDEIIATAAVLRALFSSECVLDRDLADLCDRVNKFPVVVANDALAAVLADLRAFKAATYTGVDFYAAAQTRAPNAAQTLDEVISDAKEFMPMFSYTPQASHKIVVATWQSIFSRGGELSELFQLITTANAQKFAENVERVKRFLADNFLRKNAAIDVENIDSKKFDDFIDDRWREAHKQEFPSDTVKKFEHDSKYRNNMEGRIKRVIEIMCAWVNCARTSAGNSDKNRDEFQKILPRLLKNVQAAHNEINPENSFGILGAGTTVLDRTLSELYRRLKGTYDPAEHKFFYVEFLCGDHVITDENCLPNFALNIHDGTDEDLSFQVEWHADQKKLPTPKARLKSIFGKGGSGNYGAAKVLDAYLQATEGKSFIAANVPNFDDIIAATAKDAAADQEDFKGGLISAQIDGQLQDMPDDTKDDILRIVNNCYDYAVASKNFGVLAHVKQYWKNFIDQNAERIAKRLSEDLSRATDDFKRNAKNYDAEEFQESLDYIKQLIGERTFNKAQRCIRDFGGGKLFKKSEVTEDFTLSRFIADYGDYYGLVQDCSLPLEKLPALKKLTVVRDKFSKKRAQLIENWLPNGIPRDRELGKERIRERVKNLLELLAFDVDSIELSGDDETESITYTVKLKKTFQIRHSHPIAVFGSDAESDKLGFQVLCLFGKYDEKNLIDRFKQFDTNNTLVLLDTALDLVKVRRPLDKAIKRDKSLRYVFAVIDRVVMMYLIKNCSEQIETKRINDTLMALIMPFSRCQPYVWEPTKSLPPEMFIGRENIMREVKNFDGINIVYGGRQLGKSALLKMARREIDGNNNQRAIFVDLLKEDYTEAALHVSRELIDKKFFDETFTETSDWEELTRAIRNRLSNDAPTKIPYFLLMLDEADKFIETCAKIEYKPIKALARIQQDDYNGSRFKFVIAGLHNIVRFNREQLQKDNGIFPLLKSRTITPFTHEEARQLLEVPLRYLGVNLRDDKFIDTIEETALYFPGLIQCYCEKLLLTLFDSKNYDANTPPYEISKQHLKKVLADEDFLNAIRDRINITLQLGEDRFYYVIAQLLAYLYHTNDQRDGYSPKDILTCAKKIAEELHVLYAPIKDKFLPDDPDKVDALMLELCELNILRKTDEERYHFSTTVICDYMGTLEHINDELLNLMAEADNG